MIAQRNWFPPARPESERQSRAPAVRAEGRASKPPADAPTDDECLVADARAQQTPAQAVEVKLSFLLRGDVVPLSHLQRVRAGTCRGR
jgi:hypothetical protein